MKKKFAIIAALVTLFALAIGSCQGKEHAPSLEASATKVDYVGYVDEAEAPVIDGTVDEVWNDASQLYTSSGYASVLWNEDGLYYLATVWDSTMCSKDMCAFWISEDYNLNKRWIEWYYPSNECTYDADGKSGAYYVQVFSNGDYNVSCNGSEKYADVEIAVTRNERANEWIVEVYVPHMGENTLLKENSRVGFEFSIDDYDSIFDTRASTSKWMSHHNWPYRENYTALGKIILCKSDETAVVDTMEETNDGVTTNALMQAGGSCNSSIATVGIGAILGGLFVFVKKKKE